MERNHKASLAGGISFFSGLYLVLSVMCAYASEKDLNGIVVDQEGSPIKNAVVSVQGSALATRTDIQGHFHITVDRPLNSSNITAGKFGFYNGAKPLEPDRQTYRLELTRLPSGDQEEYSWLRPLNGQDKSAPEEGEQKVCQRCHPTLTEEWQNDAHSGAAVNPVFLAFYNGRQKNGGQEAAPGYKTDFPEANGNCATCHVPALALARPFQADPNLAAGIEKEGIFCDFCHKISGVAIDQTGAKPGVLSLKLQRPSTGRQVFFGPYADVFPGDDAYHPLYAKSHYCAPCHNGKFWDVPAYSEFQEWNDSSYKTRNIHCQNCHMPSLRTSPRFALQEEGGVARNPETIPSHFHLGVQNEAFMKEAIELTSQTQATGDVLELKVTVRNVKAGHHYPTGSPMRNMILLVGVRDENGHVPDMLQGGTVPVWGGVGAPEEGNYAGLPGKGFAKVLRDAILYPDRQQRHFAYQYPAPHWRPTVIESDSRIPADGVDESRYRFQLSESLSWPVTVTVRLIYRRSYKQWMDAKNLQIPDMEIARETTTLRRNKR